jgi:hypothetical protein
MCLLRVLILHGRTLMVLGLVYSYYNLTLLGDSIGVCWGLLRHDVPRNR